MLIEALEQTATIPQEYKTSLHAPGAKWDRVNEFAFVVLLLFVHLLLFVNSLASRNNYHMHFAAKI